MGPEQFTPERIALLKEGWNEYTHPMSEEELRGLLLSKGFSQRVVDAIKKTNNPEFMIPKNPKFGQEFGFVVYYAPGITDAIHISPLFEGDETRINLYQAVEYREQIPDMTHLVNLAFHTHPSNTTEIAAARLLSSLGFLNAKKEFEPDYFSIPDLRSFRRIAEEEDMSLVYALGTKNPRSRSGKLLLVSFNNFKSFIEFNPEEVYNKSREYKVNNISAPPIEIYRAAGLNVAVLGVNLDSANPFDPEEVAQATAALIVRKAA